MEDGYELKNWIRIQQVVQKQGLKKASLGS